MHMTAARRVLRYLKKTQDFGINYKPGSRFFGTLSAFTDADWAGCKLTRKSMGGYTTFLNGPISWSAKGQSVVATSTLESEYIAASDTTKEVIWLRRLLNSIGQLPTEAHYGPILKEPEETQNPISTEVKPEDDSPEPVDIDHDESNAPPTVIHCDNQGALTFIKTGIVRAKTRHIAVKYQHCHSENMCTVNFQYVASADNLADIMTKALPGPKHAELTKRMGVHKASSAATVDDEKDMDKVFLCSCVI